MAAKRRLPAWLLGFAFLPTGTSGGLALLTVPQLLAARHVPEPTIAILTTLALVPTFAVFLVSPLVDLWVKRRTYAVAATLVCGLASLATMVQSDNLVFLGAAMILATTGAAINAVAVGGWFGAMIDKEDDATLGAWMTVANVGGFGLVALTGASLVRSLSPALAGLLLSAPGLLPLLIYAATPCQAPDRRLASESFRQFFGDIGRLLRQPVVLRTLPLFVLPSASFALTNTLGGLGGDYHANEAFVSLMGGAGTTVAGVVGSLMVPPLARRFPARAFYLSVGILGSLFTLCFILLPHTPALFGVNILGQNVVQSAALATVQVITLQSIGKDNPLAATQFALLNSASALPITYMQLLDGHAYGAGGLALMYLTDGGLGLVACLSLAAVLWRWSKRDVGPGTP